MVTKNDLQYILYLLLYITKYVKPARYLLNQMLQLLMITCILLTDEFFKDLKWVQVFLGSYNGVTFYQQSPLHKPIYLDVSLEGLGGCYDNYFHSLQIPKGLRFIAHLDIHASEMLFTTPESLASC